MALPPSSGEPIQLGQLEVANFDLWTLAPSSGPNCVGSPKDGERSISQNSGLRNHNDN